MLTCRLDAQISRSGDFRADRRQTTAIALPLAHARGVIVTCTYWCVKAKYTAVPGAPQRIQISNVTSSTISLTWSPPLVSERHGLSIFGYIINCSADHSSLGNNNLRTENQNASFVDLHPFTAYNCCVASNSNHGTGRLVCLRAVTCK